MVYGDMGSDMDLNMSVEMSEDGEFTMQVDCEYFSGVSDATIFLVLVGFIFLGLVNVFALLYLCSHCGFGWCSSSG